MSDQHIGAPASAQPSGPRPPAKYQPSVRLRQFVLHLPTGTFVDVATNSAWPASSIKGKFGAEGLAWLRANRGVDQAVKAPGEPRFIRDRVLCGWTWQESPGAVVLNLTPAKRAYGTPPPEVVARPGRAR